MSTFDSAEGKQEIIIVRRGGGDHDEGHHGGVWKIAFADFMTAMMCFFLVMWLVNASNEETKAAVASYFNPMTLMDSSAMSKGKEETGDNSGSRDDIDATAPSGPGDPNSSFSQRTGPGDEIHSLDQTEEKVTSDQHLFSDPYAVLAEIAAQTAMLQNISSKGDGGAQTSGPATGAQGGESYRDPFAPDFWSQEIAPVRDDSELDVFREAQEDSEPLPGFADAPDDAFTKPAEGEPGEIGNAAQAEAAPPQDDGAQMQEATQTSEPTPAEQLADQIRQEVADAFGEDSALNQTVTVTAQDTGVMISVTDELNYGMFQIGSAVPQGELVLAMEKIAAALNEHTGNIRINGHTDGRPFRNENYDNWRLSTARAHSAYYMLVRAGVVEARITEVAGFADRKLKLEDDPFADANRRIEIFVETGE